MNHVFWKLRYYRDRAVSLRRELKVKIIFSRG